MTDGVHKYQYHGKESLSLPAALEAFNILDEWLSGIAEKLQLPAKMRKQLLIAADEVFTNIANYGYPHSVGAVNVTVAFNTVERELMLTFSDSGIAYNPLETEQPDVSLPLAERTVGGLGIFIVKNLMDGIEYKRENNCNILILKKLLP